MSQRRVSSAAVVPYQEALTEFKRQYWTSVLAATDGNITEASRLARYERTSIYETARALGIALKPRRRCGNSAWQALGR